MSIKRISTPLSREDARALRCGEAVLLSGVIYTARDAAHKRLSGLIAQGETLPLPIEGAVIYYVGPTPAKPGRVIGSAGPTTSYRMDAFTPELIALGLTGMIGKGSRGADVVSAMRKYGAVCFSALGGAGALMAHCVESSDIVAFEDLGTEAIRKLVVRDMPLTVVIDCEGDDLYKRGREEYMKFKAASVEKYCGRSIAPAFLEVDTNPELEERHG